MSWTLTPIKPLIEWVSTATAAPAVGLLVQADQSAQDIGRYDTVKDLYRLERLVPAHPNLTAYVVLLTNDSAYWAPRSQRTTVDASFRLDEARLLTGELAWRPEAGSGTTKTREAALLLSGSYRLSWRDYSTPASGSYGRFRYLAVQAAP